MKCEKTSDAEGVTNTSTLDPVDMDGADISVGMGSKVDREVAWMCQERFAGGRHVKGVPFAQGIMLWCMKCMHGLFDEHNGLAFEAVL